MKIIKTDIKNNSKWAGDIIEASAKKFSSLDVNSGKVMCPLSNSLISTTSCEICGYCKGISFSMASNKEFIKCAHKDSQNIVQSMDEEIDRLYISEKFSEDDELTKPEDFRSIFAHSSNKFEDTEYSDLMNSNRIVSSKNISENEQDGTSNFVSKFNILLSCLVHLVTTVIINPIICATYAAKTIINSSFISFK
jgi:hypothetical protein